MKILIKAPNWIGDSVMATPAIRYLRQQAPEAQLDILCRKGVAGVLQDHPDKNRLIVFDDRRPTSDQVKELRKERYDAIALLPNSFRAAWFAVRLGIPRRVGFARAGRRLLLTHAIPYDRTYWQTPTPSPISRKSRKPTTEPGPIGHMVEYYGRICEATLRAVGFSPTPFECDRALCNPPLILPISEAAVARVATLLEKEDLANRPLVAVHPGGAYGGAKRWPLPKLAQAATLVARSLGGEAVVVSAAGPGERDMNLQLAQAIDLQFLPLGEQLDLPSLAALLARVRVLITNDSGVMHMAAAVGTPTVAVFGSTDWNVTAPWSRRARVVRQSPPCAPCFLRECPTDHACMQAISPELVATQALELIRECNEGLSNG
ncbi:MAG: glycosyltransferase family 9 protein [Candidatus Hydrogenedentota bacterium]|nr:MAG: glycosyltransferase family 9 protein [Candidatus Hydrogenedentota bacterium]GIX45198.1 MAG: ADP-heptose--LPS heptosyltransferase II [Candidatus Sumerlaea sp.]